MNVAFFKQFQALEQTANTIPHIFAEHGYNTAGYGKILHHETNDSKIWTVEQINDNWYGYQNREHASMNASVFPDQLKPVDSFKDHIFTTRAVDMLRILASEPAPFFLGIGYKLPHIELHVPYKYYAMYDNAKSRASFRLNSIRRSHPLHAPAVAHRESHTRHFYYMNDTGRRRQEFGQPLDKTVGAVFPLRAHIEVMMGYAAAVSFLDAQLGRLLDAIEELDLWKDLVIVLTADHGMHNGEKGTW